jgi:hypothetical protein
MNGVCRLPACLFRRGGHAYVLEEFEDVNELDSEGEPGSGKDRQKMRGSWSGTAKSCFCVSPF